MAARPSMSPRDGSLVNTGTSWDLFFERVDADSPRTSEEPSRVPHNEHVARMPHQKATCFGHSPLDNARYLRLVKCTHCNRVIKHVAYSHHVRRRHGPPVQDHSIGSGDEAPDFLLSPPRNSRPSSEVKSDNLSYVSEQRDRLLLVLKRARLTSSTKESSPEDDDKSVSPAPMEAPRRRLRKRQSTTTPSPSISSLSSAPSTPAQTGPPRRRLLYPQTGPGIGEDDCVALRTRHRRPEVPVVELPLPTRKHSPHKTSCSQPNTSMSNANVEVKLETKTHIPNSSPKISPSFCPASSMNSNSTSIKSHPAFVSDVIDDDDEIVFEGFKNHRQHHSSGESISEMLPKKPRVTVTRSIEIATPRVRVTNGATTREQMVYKFNAPPNITGPPGANMRSVPARPFVASIRRFSVEKTPTPPVITSAAAGPPRLFQISRKPEGSRPQSRAPTPRQTPELPEDADSRSRSSSPDMPRLEREDIFPMPDDYVMPMFAAPAPIHSAGHRLIAPNTFYVRPPAGAALVPVSAQHFPMVVGSMPILVQPPQLQLVRHPPPRFSAQQPGANSPRTTSTFLSHPTATSATTFHRERRVVTEVVVGK